MRNETRTQAPQETHEVLVAFYDKRRKVDTEDWIPCVITGYRAGDAEEDFERVDVRTAERAYHGCHPDCVRVAKAEGA